MECHDASARSVGGDEGSEVGSWTLGTLVDGRANEAGARVETKYRGVHWCAEQM